MRTSSLRGPFASSQKRADACSPFVHQPYLGTATSAGLTWYQRLIRLTPIPTAVLASLAAVPAAAQADSVPFQNDPIGKLKGVTANWRHYQPASRFCIKPDTNEYTPGGSGATATGRDPV